MQKLRLAVFNTQPPHLYFGGVERRIMETAKLLGDEVDMTVYCGTKAGLKTPMRFGGVTIVPCFSTDVAYPLDNWFFNRTIAGAVDTIKADVYEAHAVSGIIALGDGEDFELAFAVSAEDGRRLLTEQPVAGIRLSVIGEFIEQGFWLEIAGERQPLEPRGYEHRLD